MARMGRPTVLTEELYEQAEQYIKDADVTGVHVLLPTVERLALHLNVARSTLYKWSEENPEFSDILEYLGAVQGDKLIQNSLVNRYNPTISKLMLSKHGYIEQRQDDITSGGEKLGVELSADQAAQLIKARQNR